MLTSMERLQNLDNLRQYVSKILCCYDQLELVPFALRSVF